MIWAIDYTTKGWALNNLSQREPREILGSFLQLRLVFNPGAAFSFGTSVTFIFTILALAAIAVIAYYAIKIENRWWAAVLGLALGGILGNLTDRIFRAPACFNGHVIDWIELPRWPVFNVADIAIVCAALLSVLLVAKEIPPFAPPGAQK
ncbi:MAG: lipoprotein signal peptidase [Actinobacteria bacterium]|nr:lipoprotein signal peptidase [Actinomycetota bacterium]